MAGDVVTRNGDGMILTDKHGRCFRKTDVPPQAGADVRKDGLDSWVPRFFVCLCFLEKTVSQG